MIPLYSLQFFFNFNVNPFKLNWKQKWRYCPWRIFDFLPYFSLKSTYIDKMTKNSRKCRFFHSLCYTLPFYEKIRQKLKKVERPVPSFLFFTMNKTNLIKIHGKLCPERRNHIFIHAKNIYWNIWFLRFWSILEGYPMYVFYVLLFFNHG